MRKRKNRTNNNGKQTAPISDDLPIDILSRILAFLSAKSLLRFRCVCKPWRTLIDSPDFTTQHRTTFRNNVEETLIVDSTGGGWLDDTVGRGLVLRDGVTLRRTIELDNPFKGLVCRAYIHGVALLVHRNPRSRRIALWNPSIRTCTFVPLCESLRNYVCDDVVFGFGFDRSSNDYKVLAVFFLERNQSSSSTGESYCDSYDEGHSVADGSSGNDDLSSSDDSSSSSSNGSDSGDGSGDYAPPLAVVEMYSVNSNRWKRVSDQVLSLRLCGPQVFVSGTIYWRGSGSLFFMIGKCKEDRIVSFDMKTEVFSCFKLPECDYDRSEIKDTNLVVFRESLALLDCLPERCYLWVLEEHGLSKTWTRKYTIHICISNLLHFKTNGEFLFNDLKYEIKSFDIVNKRMKYVTKTYENGIVFSMGPYVESLVLSTVQRKLRTR